MDPGWIKADEINVIGRNTQGVRIMNVDEGDQLIAVVCVPPEEDAPDELEPVPAAKMNGETDSDDDVESVDEDSADEDSVDSELADDESDASTDDNDSDSDESGEDEDA